MAVIYDIYWLLKSVRYILNPLVKKFNSHTIYIYIYIYQGKGNGKANVTQEF